MRSFDDLVRTVRSDTLLIGFNDIKYMKLLKQLADSSQDKALASESLAFYEKTIAEVTRNSHNPEYLPAIRPIIAEYIMKLSTSGKKTE